MESSPGMSIIPRRRPRVRDRGVRMKVHKKAIKKIKRTVNTFTPYGFALLSITLRFSDPLTNPRKKQNPHSIPDQIIQPKAPPAL